jgi:hypothetical protein
MYKMWKFGEEECWERWKSDVETENEVEDC